MAQIRADSYCLPLISGISALPAADEIKKVSTSGLSRTRLKDCLGELFTGMQLINPHVRPPPPPQQQQPLTPYAPQAASSPPHSTPPLTPLLQPRAPSKSKPRSLGICAHGQEGEAGGQGGRVHAGGLLRSGQIRPDPARSGQIRSDPYCHSNPPRVSTCACYSSSPAPSRCTAARARALCSRRRRCAEGGACGPRQSTAGTAQQALRGTLAGTCGVGSGLLCTVRESHAHHCWLRYGPQSVRCPPINGACVTQPYTVLT